MVTGAALGQAITVLASPVIANDIVVIGDVTAMMYMVGYYFHVWRKARVSSAHKKPFIIDVS